MDRLHWSNRQQSTDPKLDINTLPYSDTLALTGTYPIRREYIHGTSKDHPSRRWRSTLTDQTETSHNDICSRRRLVVPFTSWGYADPARRTGQHHVAVY
jgi:hypothetical protein